MSNRPDYAKGFKGGAKNIPAVNTFLLPYQAKWVRDAARLKLAEKSRQIGWTWATAYGLVRRKGLKNAQLDAWISSRDDIQARLFLEDCKAFVNILSTAAKDIGELVIDDKGNSAYVLSFANGLRIHSMSSNPDAQAGKRGDRVLDEFALHPDPRKLYSIAYPGITWGGSMEIFSTHRGSKNFFNELVNEIKHKKNPKGFSFHRVTLQDALDQGFLYKLQCKLPENDVRQAMDEAQYFNFIKSGCADEESFNQEYQCIPADDNAAFLSYDLINTCVLRGPDTALRYDIETTEDFSGRKGSIRTLWKYDLEEAAKLGVPLYLGVDVGRDHDLTVLWLAMKIGGVLFPVRIVEMYAVEFDRQEKELYGLLGLPTLRRACIDETGIGKQFVERAQKKFGKYTVEAVTFTGAMKEALAYPVRMGFEDRSLRVPDDDTLTADLRAIKKETTAAGNIRFTADRGKNGHADRFWALALMVHAATGGPTGPTWAESADLSDLGGLEKFCKNLELDKY
jgi:phage FluMu gp28-like protein